MVAKLLYLNKQPAHRQDWNNMSKTEETIETETTVETEKERPCWYLIADISGDEYDSYIEPMLYPNDSDEDLPPSCTTLNKTIEKLAKKYDNGIDCEKKPILKQPTLLKWAYCPDYRTYMISVDEDEKHLVMWKKSVVH